MKEIVYEDLVTKDDHSQLVHCPEFKTLAYQYTIMYMSRVHSQAEFLFIKILALRGKLFSDYEASEIIEAFTIKTICDWEWYAERIIYECLKEDTAQFSLELGLSLPNTISLDECIGYMNGLGYFDLKNGSNLKVIAKKILVKNRNPFENINAEAKNRLDDFYILRNYVAHRSHKAKKALVKMYKKYGQNEFEEVGIFLMVKEDKNSNTIRFQDFGGAFWLAAFQILQFLCPEIYRWIIRDETGYNDKCHLRFHYLRSLSPNQPK